MKTVWRVKMVDGGDYKEDTKEIIVNGQSGEMLLALATQCDGMAPNSIHSLEVKFVRYLHEDE